MPGKSPSLTTTAIRALVLPAKALIAIAVFVDEILRPIYRPIIERLLRNPFFALLERQVSSMPRWAILVVFAVPFLVAEPLKLVAVLLFAKGRVLLGVVTFLFAQLLTFILVERIFHAGRAKLLTFWWFAWVVERAAWIRDALRATGKRFIGRVRVLVRRHA
jgi:hypothetical protein